LVWLGVWSVAGILPLSSVHGEGGRDGTHGFYFRGGIGPAIADKTDLQEYFGPRSGIQVEYDVGLRISAMGGYQFGKYFSAELETGILYNSIKSITGSPGIDASLANVPMLANAVFHIPLESHFAPYCGFGLGGSSSIVTFDHATILGSVLDGSDADLVWAGQAFAGFRYEFNARMGVGFGYKYLATAEPSWDVVSSTSTAGSGQIRFDNARTHSFLAEFSMRF